MQDILVHHGVLGQKWGIRRYQNKDGSLTSLGKERYGISSGKNLQNISFNKMDELNHPIYASYKKRDMEKYKDMFAFDENDEVYKNRIRIKEKLKFTPVKESMKALKTLIEDEDYKKSLIDHLKFSQHEHSSSSELYKDIDSALKDLKRGRVTSKLHEVFNATSSYENDEYYWGKLIKPYYELLKSSGYDAIRDVADKKYYSTNAIDPLIIFNVSKLSLISSMPMSSEEVKKAKQNAEKYLKQEAFMNNPMSSVIKALKKRGGL